MEPRRVKIFTKTETPRLSYIAGIILGDILGLDWDITTDRRRLGKNIVINYSDEELKDSFHIYPASILFEQGILTKEISVIKWGDLPVIFPSAEKSDIPFDIFAASFFLITRYEEYCPHEPDEFGRFRASSSVAWKYGFLDIPVIELWSRELTKLLLRKFQTLVFRRNQYSSLVTFDTDEPFEYLGKSLIRSIGGLLKDLTAGDRNLSDRYMTVAKGKPDPFEVFGYISDCLDRTGSDAMFFFPVGDRSRYDHNPSWKNEYYRSLVLRLSGKYRYGIHPSFAASDNMSALKSEISRLKSISNEDIKISRYHYLRILMPVSYSNLVSAGIAEDYSMGYADEPGFRAGIARPYCFFDPVSDFETGLRIVPFQVMDVTLSRYKKLAPEKSLEIIKQLISTTKSVGGRFVSIWHNTTLLDNEECIPWRIVFENMLKEQ